MSLRFDQQVVIVTGAGGNPGLGRSHAMLLAKLGARVVVNDLGVGPDGRGASVAKAERVVEEILAAGGEAIADTHSVSDELGAQAIVETALTRWGRVDALINNAGIVEFALFEEFTARDIERMLQVHLLGTIWTCRAVWGHMKAAGYGRIVNTISGSLLGGQYGSIYGAAKAGIYGLTRSLAVEGAALGIQVNALAPGATTMASYVLESGEPDPQLVARTSPDLVAPAAAFLCHKACPWNGKNIFSGGGQVFETYYARTAGYQNPAMSIDDLHAHSALVVDHAGSRDIGDPCEGERAYALRPRPYRPAATPEKAK